jgi:hypothetical protein
MTRLEQGVVFSCFWPSLFLNLSTRSFFMSFISQKKTEGGRQNVVAQPSEESLE